MLAVVYPTNNTFFSMETVAFFVRYTTSAKERKSPNYICRGDFIEL